MNASPLLPQWAPRLRKSLIWQLYENDARGILDEELIDEAGWAIYSRCKSFNAAVEAVRGKVECPACSQVIQHSVQPDELLHCPGCGWELPWRDYFHTIQHQQLSGDVQVTDLFQGFIDRFPSARTPQEKMLLIDALLHGFHWNMITGPRRATAVNLIQGRYHEVVEFLDRLSYGPGSTPGLKEAHAEWRGKIEFAAQAWQDTRLKRLFEGESE